MLYLIGGASRSGKSRLAKRLCRDSAVPYFSLDALMIAAQRTRCLAVDSRDPPELRARVLWPLTAEVIKSTSTYNASYAFEGDFLLPIDVALMREANRRMQVRAVFLGYAQIDPGIKLKDIREHVTTADWTRLRSDQDLLQHIGEHIAFSRLLQQQCRELNLPYVDASQGFDPAMDRALAALTGKEPPPAAGFSTRLE